MCISKPPPPPPATCTLFLWEHLLEASEPWDTIPKADGKSWAVSLFSVHGLKRYSNTQHISKRSFYCDEDSVYSLPVQPVTEPHNRAFIQPFLGPPHNEGPISNLKRTAVPFKESMSAVNLVNSHKRSSTLQMGGISSLRQCRKP